MYSISRAVESLPRGTSGTPIEMQARSQRIHSGRLSEIRPSFCPGATPMSSRAVASASTRAASSRKVMVAKSSPARYRKAGRPP